MTVYKIRNTNDDTLLNNNLFSTPDIARAFLMARGFTKADDVMNLDTGSQYEIWHQPGTDNHPIFGKMNELVIYIEPVNIYETIDDMKKSEYIYPYNA